MLAFFTRIRPRAARGAISSARSSRSIASLNLLWTPSKSVMFGVEGLWGERSDHNGNAGQDMRVQFSAKYNFAANIGL